MGWDVSLGGHRRRCSTQAAVAEKAPWRGKRAEPAGFRCVCGGEGLLQWDCTELGTPCVTRKHRCR